jgi:hypothetical protein
MREFWFEIVRRSFDRYVWLFVRNKGGQRRVLAYSARDYGSPEKARDAIVALQAVIPGAPIEEGGTSNDHEPFELPATTFAFVSGVLPLSVEQFPFEDDSAAGQGRQRRRRDQAKRRQARRGQEAGEPAAVAASSSRPAAEAVARAAASAAPARARTSSRGGRRAKPKTT